MNPWTPLLGLLACCPSSQAALEGQVADAIPRPREELDGQWFAVDVPPHEHSLLQTYVLVTQGPCKLCGRHVHAEASQHPQEDTTRLQQDDRHAGNASTVVAQRVNATSLLERQAVGLVQGAASASSLFERQAGNASAAVHQVNHAQRRFHRLFFKRLGAVIRTVLIVLALLLLCSILTVTTAVLLKKSWRRQVYFWWYAYPIYRAYLKVITELPSDASDEEKEKAFEPLHRQYAEQVLELVLDMGGIFIKGAQGLSAMPDKLPQAYREQFAKCTSQCRPMEFKEVKSVITAEMCSGRALRELCSLCLPKPSEDVFDSTFSSFEEDPLGVASIGQVHRARLCNGTSVVVKVQRPGAKEQFQADMATLVSLAERASAEAGAEDWWLLFAREMDRQLQQEFDYVQEANNISTMRELLLPRFSDRVELPEVIGEVTTERILTMTFLEGEGLDRAFRARVAAAGIDASKMMRSMSLLQDDPTGDVAQTGEVKTVDYSKVMDTLLEVYGFCILNKGIFNADPHPGNVLLMPDGRLGLLDFGQLKRLGETTRTELAKVIAGVLSGDQTKAVESMRRIGFDYKTEDPDVSPADIAWHQALFLLGKMPLIPFPAKIKRTEVLSQDLSDMPLLVRTVTILRGVALAFGLWVSLAEVWAPWATGSEEEFQELKAVFEALGKKNISGTWAVTHETTGKVERWELRQPPGQPFFFASREGATHKWPNGQIRGRSIEWKCQTDGSVWRGSLEDDGLHMRCVQGFAKDETYLGPHTAALESGRVGRAVSSAKGVSSTLCFAFKASKKP